MTKVCGSIPANGAPIRPTVENDSSPILPQERQQGKEKWALTPYLLHAWVAHGGTAFSFITQSKNVLEESQLFYLARADFLFLFPYQELNTDNEKRTL